MLAQAERAKQRQFNLCLQCNTQDEIANKSGVSQGRVAQIISKFKTEEINNLPAPDCLQYYNKEAS
ncbi:MAG: helix-turn-helix domain-containing protein [Candidatus Bathyarchaeota archaeon]|nr:helix-turn-helix domain-containing protein [Candidatus Bathyarchaeota archaeon]